MKKKIMAYASISLLLSYGLTACSGGGGGSSSDVGLSGKPGFSVPTEISAVPTDTSQTAGKPAVQSSFKSKLLAVKEAATDAGTDYSNAKTVKFVNEHTLEQFEIIEEVLAALSQTNYADVANINAGPYKAMVAFQDDQGGVQTKSLEPWVVDSALIVEGGKEVNRVRVWIEESDGGFTRLLKGEFKIYQSATRRSDGSYSDYGIWTLNVKFDEAGISFFAASAEIDANGRAIIKVNEKMIEGGGPGGGSFTHEMKAILNRSETDGHGKVMFPDFESCTQQPCMPTTVEAKYAYNATHLAVKKGIDPTEFKNRTSLTEMTHRYGMFDSVTGQDVLKTKSFGFPVEYTDATGLRQFAYYGAWQGRHQLWANGGTVPAATVVTRQDRGPQQTAETYTVSAPFVGTFTKRIPVVASLDDIKNIPVETWVNDHLELEFNGTGWFQCQPSAPPNPPVCNTSFTAFDTLIVGSADNRKHVNIDRMDNSANPPTPFSYIYLAASGSQQAGFYVANRDTTTGQLSLKQPLELYAPANGHRLWINIGGSIYIEYTGVTATTTSGWVEKTLVNFDTQTWTPEFSPTGDKQYLLPVDREFYINSRGANYIVKRMTDGSYDVKIEIQSTANPLNAATFVQAGTVFKSPWAPDTDSTYEFITDPANPNFMKLVYKTIGQNEQGVSPAPQVGAVAQKGQWGLAAFVNGSNTGVQFNWDYPREGDMFGSQQYLKDASNNYLLLSDPIMLLPVVLTNKLGVQKTLSLQYDGWMHGLPDLFQELQKSNFVMTAAISDKIINIPAGTPVTDAQDATKGYLIKPLEVSQFLAVVPDPGSLNISVADSIDLLTVPVFVEHNMEAMPATTGVKYSEGKLVQ